MPTTAEKTSPAPQRARRVGQTKSRLSRLIVLAVIAALVVAIGASTKWLTPAQVEALTPKAFNPSTFAAEKFPEITTKVVAKAVDATELTQALSANASEAGKKYGIGNDSGRYTIPVKVTAKVASVDENFVLLDTPDIVGYKVRIPLNAALSGTPIRDVTGDINYGDFTDQTTYQFVANELRAQMIKQVIDPLDKAALSGKTVTLYGAWATGGAPGQLIIQPVKIEVK